MPGPLRVTTPSDREIRVERDFAAPRALVFRCWTEPELVRKWNIGPDGWVLSTCEIDLRPGGQYRYVWTHSEKPQLAVTGTYKAVVPPERLVSVELFDDDWTGGEAQGTIEFEQTGAGTMVVTTMLYATEEARDGARASGMEIGMGIGYDRLEALLDRLSLNRSA